MNEKCMNCPFYMILSKLDTLEDKDKFELEITEHKRHKDSLKFKIIEKFFRILSDVQAKVVLDEKLDYGDSIDIESFQPVYQYESNLYSKTIRYQDDGFDFDVLETNLKTPSGVLFKKRELLVCLNCENHTKSNLVKDIAALDAIRTLSNK